MSVYWFPFCRTCGTDDGCCLWWNYGVDRGLQSFIRLLPALGQFARAYRDEPGIDIEIKLLGPEWTSDLLDFAAKHGDHEVVAKNEHGAFDHECGQFYACGSCGHQKPCTKPIGHEGEHGS